MADKARIPETMGTTLQIGIDIPILRTLTASL
jgi:hypothetical protein